MEQHNNNNNNGDQSDKNKKYPAEHSSDYAPYPKLDPNDVPPHPPPPSQVQEENLGTFIMGGSESESEPKKKTTDSAFSTSNSVSLNSELTKESSSPMTDHHPLPATSLPPETNPYISASPVPSSSSSVKERMDSVRDALGRWGKRVGEATKKAEDLAGNVWQHLKTAPSVTDAAMGRIAQSTKVLAEGGYEKIFRQSFETVPEEQLQNSFACYLSTSAGPVMGTLYLSTAKIAFCSDNPLSYKVGAQTDWSYYKVVIPLHQLKAVNPSASKTNPAEKYIQVVSVDGHEFWFMGFVNYDSAVQCLQEALRSRNLHSV